MPFDWGQLLGGAASVATGGVFGLVGAAISQVTDIWKRKQELNLLKERNTHELNMKKADAEIMREEWAQRTKIAQIEGDARVNVSANEAFAKSFDTEPKRFSEGFEAPKGNSWPARFTRGFGWLLMVLLDTVRGGIRPGYAIYFAWIVTSMYESQRAALALLGVDQTAQMAAVYAQIVNTMLFLFTTCVLWYYGVRNNQQPPAIR